MNRKPDTARRRALGLTFSLLLGALLTLVLAGCQIGPINLDSGTPVPTTSPVPPTETPVPPTATPIPRALVGMVADAYTGKPIAGAEVTAGGVLTATAADGRYFFDNVPTSSMLTVSAEGYRSQEIDTGVAPQVEIKLRPTSLSGRVTDSATGKPMVGVLVKLVLPSAAPAAPITPTTPITPSESVTGTVLPAATVTTTGMLGYGKVLAAPVGASLYVESATHTAVKQPSSSTGSFTSTVPLKTTTPLTTTATLTATTPLTPTATPTPKPIPPTGEGFVAVYSDEDGNYFFKDVPDGANLTFKMPGYKLTKMPVGETGRKEVALEQFKAEAIYVTANWAASPDLLDPLIEWVTTESRINAVVLNVQTDASEWVFDTKNPDVLEAKNTDIFLPEMPALVKSLKDKGIYTIARIVTFQQKTMAEQRPEWAIMSDVTGKPWKGGYAGHQKWLDVSNPAVQDHMVEMTKEVMALGFDEVQYDYVRFPSDPAPSEPGDMVFSRPLTDTGKVLALQQFLKKAYAVTEPSDVFMSIDVFGYALWPDQDGEPILGVIGQVPEYLQDYTDYICPMIYPSHFSVGEEGCRDPAACAYELVYKSGEYASGRFAGKKVKYRPWLQDFDWGDIDYTSRGTTKVTDQIRACEETDCWGWQMWDPTNEYEPRPAFKK